MLKVGDENQHKPGYIVTCSDCGTHQQKIYKGGVVPEEVVRKAFIAAGWFIGKHDHREQDKCPACVTKKKPVVGRDIKPNEPLQRETLHLFPTPAAKPALKPVMESPMSATPPVPIKPLPAKEPSATSDRAAKRSVMAFLDKVYDHVKGGYQSGWTDAKAAMELKVDDSLVESLREEFFGPALPEKTRESLAKDLAELHRAGSKLMDEQAATLQQIEHLKTTYEAGMKALRTRHDSLEERLAELRQDYGHLHQEVLQAMGVNKPA